jgi:miniconductance mechanosensitive channel
MQNLIAYIQNVSDNQIYLVYLIVIFISYLIYLFTNRIILKSISHFSKKTSTYVDDILIEKKVFNKIPYLLPLIFIYNLKDLLPWFRAIENILLSVFPLIILISLNAFINAINEIYSRSNFSNKLNIKSYIQVLKLIVNLLGIIVIISFLIGKSPVYFLSGIGALTAVLLLVFKDTILSLISSIQISSNNLFKIGDWVEASQFGADGDVIDIALHSVKIQNWDKTVSIIPTNKLIDSSFKNWRGMSESGGRRIKRSIKIDMNSIKFCNNSMIDKFKKFNIISDYISSKLVEIKKDNLKNNINEEAWLNGRSLTNIGTFRAYIEGYLRNHSSIHQEMTFLVRQLSPE